MPGAPNPDVFWQLLREGRDAIIEHPAPERRSLYGLAEARRVHAGPGVRGVPRPRRRVRRRLLRHLPARGAAMDPQQRLVAGAELGGAGGRGHARRPCSSGRARACSSARSSTTTPRPAAARRGRRRRRTPSPACSAASSPTASRTCSALRGPSLTVDTGQSSSLVAVHLACQSLRRGESDAGARGRRQPQLSLRTARSSWPHARRAVRRTAAATPSTRGANGYVRGEGGGLVVLKPLAARARRRRPRSTA